MKRALSPFLAAPLLILLSGASDQKADKVWHLNSYLNGTAEQIGHTLNHDVERLVGERNETREKLARHKKEYDAAEKKLGSDVLKSPDYLKTQTEEAIADADLRDARANGSPQDRLDAGAKLLKIKAKLEKMKADAVATDPAASLLRDTIAKEEKSVVEFSDAIGRAEAWRRQIIEAAKNTFAIQWPLAEGDKGIVGIVTPTVIKEGGFLAEYEAIQPVNTGVEQEGIAHYRAIVHPVTLAIVGVDTSAMQVGKPINMDTAVLEIVNVQRDADAGVMCALKRVESSDEEKLLKSMTTLKADITVSQLDDLVNESKRVAASGPAMSIPQILLNMPPECRRPHSGWTADTLGKANEWLLNNAVHRKIESDVMIGNSSEIDGDSFELQATAKQIEGWRTVELIMQCPAGLKNRTRTLAKGSRVTAKGEVEAIQIAEDGTVMIRLVNASF